MTVCDQFQPIIREGQPCYLLDIAKSVERSTKAGIPNGLWILLDPSPFRLNVSTEMKPGDKTLEFKVYVHTLAQYTANGPGEYAMSAIKDMKGTKSFKQLPDIQKNCQDHNREECETKRFLDQVQNNCNCVPWALMVDVNSKRVGC